MQLIKSTRDLFPCGHASGPHINMSLFSRQEKQEEKNRRRRGGGYIRRKTETGRQSIDERVHKEASAEYMTMIKKKKKITHSLSILL